MVSLAADDQLTIINRTTEHRISKQLIRKIPYFERMLSHDLLESKENKVELDFDERAFKWFLNWLENSHIVIEMESVICLCSIADYFSLEDNLTQDCTNYFHDRFSIENLTVVLPQISATSKLINTDKINIFICRHFLKIANTTVWLDYPIETIEYICALDLMIYSEYQVFDAIMKWVNFKADTRKCYLEDLLKSIRWCHLEDKDLTKIKELLKSSDLEAKFSVNVRALHFNRAKQNYLVEIYELSTTSLRIIVLGFDFMPLMNRVIELNKDMDLYLLHDEHVSDIFFNSGRQGIRIDWKRNEYRLLNFDGCRSQYIKLLECLKAENCGKSYKPSTQTYGLPLYDIRGYSFLEAHEMFIVISSKSGYFDCWPSVDAELIQKEFHNYEKNFIATFLNNNIYLLSNNKLIRFNIDDGQNKIIKLPGIMQGSWFDTIFSSQTHDSVILVNQPTRDVFFFNINTQQWSSKGRLANRNCCSTDGQKQPNKLLTFTSAFLAMERIGICSKN